tara:strand:- start:309305 stop:310159 length:855 start_codon:yes stop_codon:yes gene_type:complete
MTESYQLSDFEQKKFEASVHHEIRDAGKNLKSMALMKDSKGARSIDITVYGGVMMEKREGYEQPLPVQKNKKRNVILTMEDYSCSVLTDIFLNEKVNFDDKQELKMEVSAAIERKMDQIIIDALNAHSYGSGNTVADPTKVFSMTDHLKKIARLMDDKGAVQDRNLLLHAYAAHDLLGDDKVGNINNNSNKVLVKGSMDKEKFYGFDFTVIGSREEGGLPKPSATSIASFAWVRKALALGINMQPRIEVIYDGQYGAHRVNAFLSGGAKVVDGNGVVKSTSLYQ